MLSLNFGILKQLQSDSETILVFTVPSQYNQYYRKSWFFGRSDRPTDFY